MGYRCPVCGDPQADESHLANHLAFTALVRGGAHESWLDERVPGWEGMDESGLGSRITDHAEETEFPQVFEQSVEPVHTHEFPADDAPRGTDVGTELPPDGEVQELLERARELTERRRSNATEDDEEE